jgi:molybdopterin-guanine dinucleotide biosynthesis protein MobB
MAIPCIAIMGWSGSGKTTFIEGLLPEMRARGIKTAVVKHDGHDFQLDREGKDTYRFAEAGAEIVAISSSSKAAVMYYRPTPIEELISGISGVDIILVEGWKNGPLPKVEVHRRANGKPRYLKSEELLALVTDEPEDGSSVPQFSLSDYAAFAEFLQSCLKNGKI